VISGGRRREWELLRRVHGDVDIHLVVVSKTEGSEVSDARRLAQACRSIDVFAAEPGAGRDRGPEQVRRHRCARAALRVGELVRRGVVDLVHVEGYYLMQHVPATPQVPVVLVEQNVEYELAYQRAAVAPAGRAQVELFSHALRTRAAEVRAWRAATHLAAVTDDDRAVIESELPGADVAVVPDGADHLRAGYRRARMAQRPAGPLVVLVANFAYAPNVDAARHLCLDILPLLRRRVPDVHTWLVGNAPPAEVRALAGEAVTVTGRVPDVTPYLDSGDVVVCPLRIGGGIKVKTIEALRRGCAIVSTPVGAQGLDARARAALSVQMQPADFARAVADLLMDPERRREHQRRARAAARELATWDDAADALRAVYAAALHARRRTPAGAPPLAHERSA
jgi:glycosyltransferase involved in cell wall biosynthesis